MQKSRRDYKKEATREPFELRLEDPPEGHPGFVTFKDPTKIATRSAFSLARNADPTELATALLSPEDYKAWWAEWGDYPADETNELIADVMKYYGADPGKLAR